MFRDSRIIENNGAEPLAVWLEPWGSEYHLMPGSILRFDGISEKDGRFEVVDYGDKIGVYEWPGAFFKTIN